MYRKADFYNRLIVVLSLAIMAIFMAGPSIRALAQEKKAETVAIASSITFEEVEVVGTTDGTSGEVLWSLTNKNEYPVQFDWELVMPRGIKAYSSYTVISSGGIEIPAGKTMFVTTGTGLLQGRAFKAPETLTHNNGHVLQMLKPTRFLQPLPVDLLARLNARPHRQQTV